MKTDEEGTLTIKFEPLSPEQINCKANEMELAVCWPNCSIYMLAKESESLIAYERLHISLQQQVVSKLEEHVIMHTASKAK